MLWTVLVTTAPLTGAVLDVLLVAVTLVCPMVVVVVIGPLVAAVVLSGPLDAMVLGGPLVAVMIGGLLGVAGVCPDDTWGSERALGGIIFVGVDGAESESPP